MNYLEKFIIEQNKKSEDIIRKAFPMPFEEVKDEIIKAKRAQIGEVREWGGVKMRKEVNGWVPVKDGSGKPKAEEAPGKEGGETPSIEEHAKKASEAALQNAIKNSPDPEVRAAAHRELERRNKEEKSEMFSKPEGEDRPSTWDYEDKSKVTEPHEGPTAGTSNEKLSESKPKKEEPKQVDENKSDNKIESEEVNKLDKEKKEQSRTGIPSDKIIDNEKELKNLIKKFDGDTLLGSENLKNVKNIISESQKTIKGIEDKFPDFNNISNVPDIIEKIGKEEYEKLHNTYVNAVNNLYYIDKFARNQLKKEGMTNKGITMELNIFPKQEAWKHGGKTPSEVYGEGGSKEQQDIKDTANADKFVSGLDSAITKWMEDSAANGGDTDNPSGKAVDDILFQLDNIDSGMGTLGEVIGEKLSYLDPYDKDSVKKVINEIKNKIVRNKSKLPDFKSTEIKKSLPEDIIEKRTTYKFLEGQGNLLQKSHINEFVFNDNFSVAKTGLELKKKFEEQLKMEIEEIRENSRKAAECLKEIGEQPTESFEDEYYWVIDGYEDKIQQLPMVFKSGGEIVDMKYSNQERTIQDKKYDYNGLARKIVDGMIEIIHLNTLINSMIDGKTYKLNIKQAAILGF